MFFSLQLINLDLVSQRTCGLSDKSSKVGSLLTMALKTLVYFLSSFIGSFHEMVGFNQWRIVSVRYKCSIHTRTLHGWGVHWVFHFQDRLLLWWHLQFCSYGTPSRRMPSVWPEKCFQPWLHPVLLCVPKSCELHPVLPCLVQELAEDFLTMLTFLCKC